jgi:hypothetical protein
VPTHTPVAPYDRAAARLLPLYTAPAAMTCTGLPVMGEIRVLHISTTSGIRTYVGGP